MNNCVNRNGMVGTTAAALRDRIKAYDFALYEMNLFLDTHPEDSGALELLYAYRHRREELVAGYEQSFGPYVVTAADVNGDRWSWVDNPWPWEYNPAGRE